MGRKKKKIEQQDDSEEFQEDPNYVKFRNKIIAEWTHGETLSKEETKDLKEYIDLLMYLLNQHKITDLVHAMTELEKEANDFFEPNPLYEAIGRWSHTGEKAFHC